MRHQLQPLLHQRVVLIGRLNKCQANGIGSLDVCLRAVEVRPWRQDVALLSLPAVRVHHGWLQMHELQHTLNGPVPMLCVAACVEPYRRRNGLQDLGFRTLPSLFLDQALSDLHSIATPSERSEQRQRLLQRINDSQDHFSLEQQPAALIQALENADAPPSTDPVALKPFSLKRREATKTGAVGFGSSRPAPTNPA